MNAGASLEVLRGWLSTGLLGAIVIILSTVVKPVVNFLIEARKLKMQEKREDRQGYGELIETLTAEVKEYVGQIRELRADVSMLNTENGFLRTEVRELHQVIDGLRRQTLQGNISAQREIADRIDPERTDSPMKRALEALDRLVPDPTPEGEPQARPAAAKARRARRR